MLFYLQYLLFTIYLALAAYFLSKSRLVKGNGLHFRKEVLPLFLLRVFAGLVLGFIYANSGVKNDYWANNTIGFQESYNMLMHNPGYFIKEFFKSDYGHYGNFLGATESFWNDFGEKFLFKLLAIANVFTRGNYYLNALLVNMVAFFGSVLLYKVFNKAFQSKFIAVVSAFLVPSAIFFSSGIHKDAEIFFLSSVYVYCMYFGFREKMTFKRVFLMAFSLLLMVLIKDYVGLLMLACTFYFALAKSLKFSAIKAFGTIVAMGFVALLSTTFLPAKLNPIKYISDRQEKMLELPVAKSQVALTKMEPSIVGLLQNAPEAMKNTVLLPTVFSNQNKILAFAGVENLLMLILLVLAFIKPDRKVFGNHFFYFSILLALLFFLIIGFTTPNLGTIVRYRSLALPFVIAALLALNKRKMYYIIK